MSTNAPSADADPSTSALQKASWIAVIVHCAISTSIAVAVALLTAPPLLLVASIAVLALTVSLLSWRSQV